MTITEIAVDLIRERDQLRERIQKLEALSTAVHHRGVSLEQRIQKMELEMDTLLSRISEAQRILQGFRVSTLGTVAAPVIDDALKALEGK